MKRAIFGHAAKKQKLSPPASSLHRYPGRSLVLGAFLREKDSDVAFQLPDGRVAKCPREMYGAALEGIENRAGPVKKTTRYMPPLTALELTVVEGRKSSYVCSFFSPRGPHADGIVAGIVKTAEETGYTVHTGNSDYTFLLPTEKRFSPGSLHLFQIARVKGSVVTLKDEIERAIYVGKKEEIAPGLVLRASITGVPKHICGQPSARYTNKTYRFTSSALGVCNPVIESNTDLDVSEDIDVIVVYASTDREVIHAVPYKEYLGDTQDKLQKATGLLSAGEALPAKVLKIFETHALLGFTGPDGKEMKGFLYNYHYNDFSTAESKPFFAEGDIVDARVYSSTHLRTILTLKKALFSEEKVSGYQVKDVVRAVAVKVSEASLHLTLFDDVGVTVKRRVGDTPYVGKVYTLCLLKKITDTFFIGSEELPEEGTEKEKENENERENGAGREGERRRRRGVRIRDTLSRSLVSEKLSELSNGDVVEGVIETIYQHGAFIRLNRYLEGRIKISEVSSMFIKDWQSAIFEGQRVKAVVYDINRETLEFECSIKKYEVLSASGEGAPQTAPPSVPFGVEDAEHSETADSSSEYSSADSEAEAEAESNSFERSVFTNKNNAVLWIKKMSTLPIRKALSLALRALAAMDCPEEKQKIDISIVNLISVSTDAEIAEEEVVERINEGYLRGGVAFLKRTIDCNRATRRPNLINYLIRKCIKEDKYNGYGYKELIRQLEKDGDIEKIKETYALFTSLSTHSPSIKEMEDLYVASLYSLSKEEGRTAVETFIKRSSSAALFIKYIELEEASIQSKGDLEYLRRVFERAIKGKDQERDLVKKIFKKYLQFEKEFGGAEREKEVIRKAKEYVEG